jgi:hypothetical protein
MASITTKQDSSSPQNNDADLWGFPKVPGDSENGSVKEKKVVPGIFSEYKLEIFHGDLHVFSSSLPSFLFYEFSKA